MSAVDTEIRGGRGTAAAAAGNHGDGCGGVRGFIGSGLGVVSYVCIYVGYSIHDTVYYKDNAIPNGGRVSEWK